MCKQACEAVFLFISELTGSFVAGSGTQEDKIKCGQQDYINNHLPELDLSDEEDRKELSELVWLERLYEDLDGYFDIYVGDKQLRAISLNVGAYREANEYKWAVPLELDCSASMLQIMGILLNDRRLMEMTNVIGDTLEDPWKLEGMSRNMLKTAATPMLYASSQSCSDLWSKAKIPFDSADVELYSKEMSSGPFGLANMFKEFIVNNCKLKPTMNIKIGNDEFTTSCNRFRNVGEKTNAYKIWDSIDKQYNTLLHTDTKKVPDLDQFRRYQVTLLVHNIDSQIMDAIMVKLMDKHDFGIPVHDAVICSPEAAADVREWYKEEVVGIYNSRESILKGFFKSIGITNAAKEQWDKLKEKIVPFEGNLAEEFSMPLK